MRYYAAILSCFCALGQAPSTSQIASPNAKPEAKCSIEGTVVNSVTAEPVRKVRVQLKPLDSEAIPYATTTDASGHFFINEVDAGHYELTAVREGFSSPPLSAYHAFALAPGQEMKDIVLKLSPVAVISGRILDEDGDPVNHATVACIRFRYIDGVRRLVDQGYDKTNDAGDFRLSISSPGKYEVRATPPPKEMQPVRERPIGTVHGQAVAAEPQYVPTYYPQTGKPNAASALEVTPGAHISGINITLLRGATVRIRGHVKSPGAANPAPTFIQLEGWDYDQKESVADAEGRFQFSGVLPGSYSLFAVGCNRDRARAPIEVGDQDIEGIEVILQPPATVQGRIVFEGKADSKGEVPKLILISTTGEEGMLVQVHDDLTFKADSLTPGLYRFRVDGVSNTFIKRVKLGGQDVTEAGFDAPESSGDLTVLLSPNAGVIEGTVKNAKDEPAPGVLVTLIPEASRRTRLHRIASTDQNGRFKIRGIIPGEYKIYAWEQIEDGAYEDPDFMKAHESDGEKVSIKEGSHENMSLKLIAAESAGEASGRK